MRRVWKIAVSALLCLLLLCVPIVSLAEGNVTAAMRKSERSLNSIVSESSDTIRANLFTEFVESRLKYLTVRSASKVGGGKWLGSVTIAEEFENGEHLRYLLEEALVQYGYQDLPENTVSCTLSIGDVTETIDYDGQAVFDFDNIELDEKALDSDIRLRVRYYGSNYSLGLTEHYSIDTVDLKDILGPMSDAYVKYVETTGEMKLVDHTILKVKSYVTDVGSESVSFIWELYLIHGEDLPAEATLIRYDTGNNVARVYSRTLHEYF